MKVAIVHNRYMSSSPSGENQIVDADVTLLRAAGIDVIPFFEDSDQVLQRPVRTALKAATGPVHSPGAVRRFRRLLDEERPDVVHVHNVFPLISPSIVVEANRHGTPVVQTVHNYRHTCVNGLHFRDGHNCTECVGRKLPIPSVRHGCYRGSSVQSLPMALSSTIHARTWAGVDRFLAPSLFVRDYLMMAGIPAEQISIRPSWVPDPGHSPVAGRDIIFVGRLDRPKGLPMLLKAWRSLPMHQTRHLRIVGDGPLADEVSDATRQDPSIHYLGRLKPAAVMREMKNAAAIVVPSLTFEGYPLVLAEAFGIGRPAIVTGGGSLPGIVDEAIGWVAAPQAEALAEVLFSVTDEAVAERGKAARIRYEMENSPMAAIRNLTSTYNRLLSSATDQPPGH